MKSTSGIKVIFVSVCAICVVLMFTRLSLGEGKTEHTPIVQVPQEIRIQAATSFKSGKKLHIWRGDKTEASIQSFMGQTLIS